VFGFGAPCLLSRVGLHRHSGDVQPARVLGDRRLAENEEQGYANRLQSPVTRPVFDFRPQPKSGPAGPKINHRFGHIRVATLVRADAIPVAEAEQTRHLLSIDQILGSYMRRHSSRVYTC
jgi:hypothetical protein